MSLRRILGTVTTNAPQPINRTQRWLATTVAAIIGLSLVGIAAVLIANAAGMSRGDFTKGVWPMITVLPLFGLPIAFLLLIVLLIVTFRSRKRQAAE